MKHSLLRGSTALAMALTMSAQPYNLAFAQSEAAAPVDCVADAANPACAETPVVEAAPAEAPDAQPPVEQTLVEEAPAQVAPVEEPVAETPVQEAAPVEAVPVEVPAAEAPAAEVLVEVAPAEAPTQEPLAQTPEVADDTATEAQSEQAQPEQAQPTEVAPARQAVPASEAPVEATAIEEAPVEQTGEAPVAPAEPTSAAAAAIGVESESPASVVPDQITAEQSAQIQAEEQRRRDDARERRDELLGAAAVGAIVGVLIPALGGTVVEDQGDRIIVERDGEYFVRRDESSLLRDDESQVRIERLRNGRTQETVTRRNGTKIVTIRDQGGFVLYRSHIQPDGREYVLIDNLIVDDRAVIDYGRQLPPLRLDIQRDRYIVPARQANYDVIYETFAAPPVEAVDQAYTLRQVRESERLRDKVRRVDLDTITFDTGRATVRQSQVPLLDDIARAFIALIDRDPSTLLLIEGHTDAVGSDISNLALSDRRAETVARILVNVYAVPAENLIVQGYGEQYLKIQTELAEQQNRRVTIRNITSLVSTR